MFHFFLKLVLTAVGFGTLGPVGGTLAALIQAVVYGPAVPAGALFGALQRLGMGLA